MKRALNLLAVVIIVGLVLGLAEAQFHWFRRLAGAEELSQRELAMRILGQYLGTQFPGKKVLVFSNPFVQEPGHPQNIYQFEKAGLRGLRSGLGKTLPIDAVVFPEPRREFRENRASVYIPATTTPLSYVIAGEAWDRLIQQHPASQIVVSLIGLPADLRQTEMWKNPQGPKFALLLPDLRVVGQRAEIVQAITSGRIAAMVLNKPGAPPEDQPLGHDLKMEFDQRFLLVTPESLDPCLKAFPRLF
jgi:hypothetical protein